MALAQLNQGAAAVLPTLREVLSAGLFLQSVPRMLAGLLLWARLLALLGKHIQAAELAGLADAHPGTEAESREKRLVTLKIELAAALPSDVFESALTRGVSLNLETAVQELLQSDWDALVAERLM